MSANGYDLLLSKCYQQWVFTGQTFQEKLEIKRSTECMYSHSGDVGRQNYLTPKTCCDVTMQPSRSAGLAMAARCGADGDVDNGRRSCRGSTGVAGKPHALLNNTPYYL